MLPSPYSPGSMPAYLAGRAPELELIRTRLARMSALGRSGGPLLAFYGSRGLGKTSLMREAQRQAIEAGFLTVWVTGRDDVPLAPDLARGTAAQVRHGAFGDLAQGLLQRLDKVEVEVGVPGAKVGFELDTGKESAAVEQTLEEAARFAREHDRHGLAVFVDEFQEARRGDRRSLLIALQHFDGAPTGAPVAMIAAGLPSMLSAVPEAATFGERTDFVEIALLAPVAAAEALILPAREVGVEWDTEALEAAIALARGYPQHVQLVGESTWAVARPEAGDTLTIGHVAQGAEQADARMRNLFASRVSKVNLEQRRFLDAMAEVADGGDEPVARGDVAGVLGVSTEALSRTRQELLDRGLIESAGRGRLSFSVPGFAAWLREVDDELA